MYSSKGDYNTVNRKKLMVLLTYTIQISAVEILTIRHRIAIRAICGNVEQVLVGKVVKVMMNNPTVSLEMPANGGMGENY